MEQAVHIPVAIDRCIELLTPAILASDSPLIVDATLGLGGHSFELLHRFPNLKIIAIDRDLKAIKKAEEKLEEFRDRIFINQAIFSEFDLTLAKNNVKKIDGALFDLGVSSMQLDFEDRGFSYAKAAPLDMRMDQNQKLNAQEIINTYEKPELIRILQKFGEEKFAKRIAENIVKNRGKISNTLELSELVKASIPAPARRTGGNPAKRTFQALRIEVNGELEAIELAIPQALEALKIGGRLVVMSYQSLEDKIVKRTFEKFTRPKSALRLPIELPGTSADFRLITRGSEGASESEILKNPRAKSMRLRAIERVAA